MQVVSVGVDNIFATLFGCHSNVPLKNWKIRYRSIICMKSAFIGEKVAKIGPVYPEIFD